MAQNKELQLKLTANDQASKKLSGAFGAIQNNIGKIVAGLAAFKIGSSIIKQTAKFEDKMANVNTLLQDDKAVKNYSDGIMKLAKNSRVPMNDMADSLYGIVSAGVDSADTMNVLKGSADLAVGGLGSIEQAVDLSTSAINAFGLEGDQATEVFGTMFATVKNGKTTVSELTQGFGGIAAGANAAGINLNQLMSATGALTTTGSSASEAYTGLKATIKEVIKPTEELKTAYQNLKVDGWEQLIEKEGDFKGALDSIKTALENENIALSDAIASTEAYNAILGLTGEVGDSYVTALEDMKNGTNNLDEAVKLKNATFQGLVDILKNRLTVVMTKIGKVVMPYLIEGLTGMIGWIEANEEAIGQYAGAAVKVLGKVVNAIGAVIGALETMANKIVDGINLMNEMKAAEGSINRAALLREQAIQKGVDVPGVTDQSEAHFKEQLAGKSFTFGMKNTDAYKQNQANPSGAGSWGRANGGVVSSGTPYTVGERGMETFIPATSGRISPRPRGGSVINVNVTGNNINGDGGADELAEKVSEKIVNTLRLNQRLSF